MTRKAIIGIGIISAILATALIVSAQTTTTPRIHPKATTTPEVPQIKPKPKHPAQILEVNSRGKVTLRGTIESISNNSLKVRSWGGVWTINVSNSTELLPAKVGKDITKFKVGDFVGVMGKVSTTTDWTIDATLIRDWTY